MNLKLRVQLSAMMFVQFFVWGSWYVTAPNYLGTIGFGANDFGWTYSVGPIASMISPFFVGMIADRFFPAQRVLAALHLLGGAIILYATTQMTSQATPDAINLTLFGYTLTYFPTLALTNTLAMKNMSDSEKEFPAIRVWGTIGWIAAGLALTFLGWEKNITMFYLTAGSAIGLGLYSLTLPHTPPVREGKVTARQLLGLDALALLKDRSYLIFMAASFLVCIPLAFYYQITSRMVEMTGLPIGQTMSYGQMSEIFFMLVMPFFFARLGVKWMLGVGMLAWVVRYALFSFGAPDEVRWMIIVGIVLHGICYDFFFVTGQIYTDQVAPNRIRAQAQGLLVLFTLGLGMAIGAKIAGVIEAQHTTPSSQQAGARVASLSAEIEQLQKSLVGAPPEQRGTLEEQIASRTAEKDLSRKEELKAIEWMPLWGKPALFAAGILLLFLLFFRPPSRGPDGSPAAAVGD
jgi:nucleoside transporter